MNDKEHVPKRETRMGKTPFQTGFLRKQNNAPRCPGLSSY
jgi:hypothetical protein